MSFSLIKKVVNKIFYNPYRFVRNSAGIRVGNSILDKTFKIRFPNPRQVMFMTVGDHCILRNECIFESDEGQIDIGNNVFINTGTRLISRSHISIGDYVTIAWDCTIYDHDSHSLDHRERMMDQERQLQDWKSGNFISSKNWSVVRSDPIVIGAHAWLGFDVIVLKGVTIGEGAVIGAGSVVASDIPAWTVAAGNPAKVVKHLKTVGIRHD